MRNIGLMVIRACRSVESIVHVIWGSKPIRHNTHLHQNWCWLYTCRPKRSNEDSGRTIYHAFTELLLHHLKYESAATACFMWRMNNCDLQVYCQSLCDWIPVINLTPGNRIATGLRMHHNHKIRKFCCNLLKKKEITSKTECRLFFNWLVRPVGPTVAACLQNAGPEPERAEENRTPAVCLINALTLYCVGLCTSGFLFGVCGISSRRRRLQQRSPVCLPGPCIHALSHFDSSSSHRWTQHGLSGNFLK